MLYGWDSLTITFLGKFEYIYIYIYIYIYNLEWENTKEATVQEENGDKNLKEN